MQAWWIAFRVGHLVANFSWVDLFLVGCSTILSCWHANTAWFSAAPAESDRPWNSQYHSNPKPWPATRCPSLYYVHRHMTWVTRQCWCDIAKIYYTLTVTHILLFQLLISLFLRMSKLWDVTLIDGYFQSSLVFEMLISPKVPKKTVDFMALRYSRNRI